MKNATISIKRVSYILVCLSLIWACQKFNPLEGLEVVVDTNIYKAPVSVQFIDANADANATPPNVTVTISGPGKDLVLSDLGEKTYTVSNGVLTLVLAEEAIATTTNPIIFTVAATAPGYVSNTQTITVTDVSQPLAFSLPLTKVSNAPSGAEGVSQTVALASGTTIVVPNDAEKTEKAEITIAPGTQVKDASGNVINATSVNTQIVQYTTSNEESLNSFPGGFTSDNITTSNGTTTGGTFTTGGFVAVDMEANGTAVKSFSKPIDVKVEIADDLVNPETGELAKEGDEIPVWSYENATGAWKEEGVSVISKNSAGKLVATFKAAHLSYWNLDWQAGYCTKGWNRYADNTITVNINSNVKNANPGNYKLEAWLRNTKTGRSRLVSTPDWWNSGWDISNGVANKLAHIGKNANELMYLRTISKKTNKILGTTSVFDPCAVSTITMTVNDPDAPVFLPVDVDFTAKCTNKNVVVRPSAWVYFYKLKNGNIDYSSWSYAYVQQGKASVVVEDGAEYYVYAYYNNKAYWNRAVFNKNTSTSLPGQSSSGTNGVLKGTTSYNATTGRVSLVATYELSTCK